MKSSPTQSEKQQRQSAWAWIYDHLAGMYDSVDWFTFNATHRYRLKLVPCLPETNSTVLEIGVGTGKLHHYLAQHHRCYGIDRARGMLKKTHRRLRRAQLSAQLSQADAIHLPWQDAAFDAIVSTFVFSAIPDLKALLHECDRILKPEGKLIIIDAGRAEDENLFANLLARSWELLGDYIHDERPTLHRLGYTITYKEFAPKGCVHLVCAQKPRSGLPTQ